LEKPGTLWTGKNLINCICSFFVNIQIKGYRRV
jgi:hypothetical protein